MTDQKLKGKSSSAEIIIQIIRPTWKREMSITAWSKRNDYAWILITLLNQDVYLLEAGDTKGINTIYILLKSSF